MKSQQRSCYVTRLVVRISVVLAWKLWKHYGASTGRFTCSISAFHLIYWRCWIGVVLRIFPIWEIKHWVIKHSVCKLSILHWRVGDIQQMRRLARGNHGNLATGQPWHLFTLSASGKTYTYHLLPSGESGCGKSPKHSKPCAQVKHEIKTTAMVRAQWRGLLTSNAFQVKLHYKWPHESHIWPPVIAHWVSWLTLYNLCRKM